MQPPRPVRRARRPLALAALGAAAVVLLTSCTGGSGDSSTDDSPAAGPQARAIAPAGGGSAGASSSTADGTGAYAPSDVAHENAVATCMKQRGFTYVPHPIAYGSSDSPYLQNTGPLSLLRSDSEVRSWRQKYGFGINSAVLDPNDPQVIKGPPDPPNPNNAIVAALDPARRRAYNIALGGTADGNRVRTGNGVKPTHAFLISCLGDDSEPARVLKRFADADESDQKAMQAKKEAAARLVTQFTNDPQVQAAAKKYENCLTQHGLNLQAVTIEYLNNAAADAWSAAHPMSDTPSAESARAQLPSEISAALIDVGCRGPYADLVRAKWPTVPAAIFNGAGGGVG